MIARIVEEMNRDDALLSSLTAIWRRSVEKTHSFLTSSDISEIEAYVPSLLRDVPVLVVIYWEYPLGFMGIDGHRLEMLFLDPDAMGKGLGKELLSYGIQMHGVDELTVNEDNPDAAGFYRHMGFETYRRTDSDEEGRPFPLLYMKRRQS